MDLKRINYFLEVAERESISAAARAIPVAQPALTRQLKLLEEEVGASLFHRSHRGIELTPSGLAFYASTRRLKVDYEEAKRIARDLHHGYRERLRVGVTPLHPWIANITQLLMDFKAASPEAEVQIESKLSGHQVEALLDEGLDAGIMFFYPESHPQLRSRCLYRDHMVLVVNRHSALASRPPSRLADLNGEDFIWFKRDSTPGSYDQLKKAFDTLGFEPNIVQECSDNTTMRCLVAAQMGCTLLPSLAISDAPEDIISFRVPDLTLELPLMLVWHPSNRSPGIERLASLAKAIAW